MKPVYVPPRTPFPPAPSAGERAWTVLALAGMTVLAIIVVVAIIGATNPTPATDAPPVQVTTGDRFGPPGGGLDESRFYGPSELLEDLQGAEISQADLLARWAELYRGTVDNISAPVIDLVVVLDEGVAP